MRYSMLLVRFFAAGIFLASIGGAHRAAASDMFQDLIAAWNAHDPDKVAAMFTDDALYEDVTLGMKSRGTEEIRKFAKFTFDAVPDIKIELTSSFGGRSRIFGVGLERNGRRHIQDQQDFLVSGCVDQRHSRRQVRA